jgi:hypothetical protein
MDSVYDAALKHADKLQSELTAVKAFIELHEHFRDRLGFGPAKVETPEPAAEAAPEPTHGTPAEEAPKVETAEAESAELSAEPKVHDVEEPAAELSADSEPGVEAATTVKEEVAPSSLSEPVETKLEAETLDAETVAVDPSTEPETEAAVTVPFQGAVEGVLAHPNPVHAVVAPSAPAPVVVPITPATTVTGYTV